eukprot:CAMPEP_0174912580 /NCGR_PEP_ID=MMETSP0167-20121228/79860_1 /TAXON_ID=38298 /ORGANISM="Rhodella maculata, Strain CCMP736" /LENGTH=117 /DNA_ID=CAMNT_0016157239 /DNA_START=419 /DNA_END=772 /DNA_ORIENTATION=-
MAFIAPAALPFTAPRSHLSASAFAPAAVAPRAVATRPSAVAPMRMDVSVTRMDNEPLEAMMRRFKRSVNNSGHLRELRHKRYFESTAEERIRKNKENLMRKKMDRMMQKSNQNRMQG